MLLVVAFACAPNSTSPGAKTSPYTEQLSGTAEPAADAGTSPAAFRFIVQAKSTDAAAELVRGVGGRVTHRLEIIHAVGAELTQEQLTLLEAHDDVRGIWEDRKVRFEPQR